MSSRTVVADYVRENARRTAAGDLVVVCPVCGRELLADRLVYREETRGVQCIQCRREVRRGY